MNLFFKSFILLVLFISVALAPVSNLWSANPEGQLAKTSQTTDTTVTDYDGNVYHTVTIGNQVWLKENLKSIHYADGTPIPDVVAYNNSDSMAQIYGRLYTWNAATRDSTGSNVQGVSPSGWHVPSDAEWKELENYLGGSSVAGGKMKTEGTVHWLNPNTGATNSSGFSALPAGEWDPNNSPNFRLLNQYAVFWTSTSVGASKARERYLAYNKSSCTTFDWYKTLKYSIRCVRNIPATGIKTNNTIPGQFTLQQNFPNPFNPSTKITYSIPKANFITIRIYDMIGREVQLLVNEFQNRGTYTINFDAEKLSSGIYLYKLQAGKFSTTKKMLLVR